MTTEIFTTQFVSCRTSFVHFSPVGWKRIGSSMVTCVKGKKENGEEFFFSVSPQPNGSVKGECLGFSASLGRSLGLREGEPLLLTPVYNLPSLSSIYVKPASEDDFQMLHSCASTVESSLLTQIRVVWPKMVFPVWISPSICISLFVESVKPDVKYGRLEEYSEVVVECIGGSETVQEASTEEEGFKCLVMRSVPLEECPALLTSLPWSPDTHPYRALIPRPLSTPVLARLTPLLTPGTSLVISLHQVSLSSPPLPAFSPLPLFLSKLLMSHCNLHRGQKIIIEILNNPEEKTATGVLISAPSEGNEDKDVVEEVKEKLVRGVSDGGLLLPGKGPYPLPGGRIAQLTLRPLGLDWAVLSPEHLSHFSYHLNTYQSSEALPSLPSSSSASFTLIPFKKELEEGQVSAKLGLSLYPESSGPHDSPLPIPVKVPFLHNIIFTGGGGSGKSSLALSLLEALKDHPGYCYVHHLSCVSLKGKRVESLGKCLTQILDACKDRAPSYLFLDDLDSLVTTTQPENSEAAFHSQRVSQKLVELMSLYQRKHLITLVATVSSAQGLSPSVYSPKGKSLFNTLITIPPLNKKERFEFLKNIVSTNENISLDGVDFEWLAGKTEGYSLLDLRKLWNRILFEGWKNKGWMGKEDADLVVTEKEVTRALEGSRPVALHQAGLQSSVSLASWEDVGGLSSIKDRLIQVICWPTTYSEILMSEDRPVKLQSGVLLYGPPGTGKTLLASAIAAKASINFISIKGPELMSKYIGESEEGVRKLFQKAQGARPCLLFFDEFDSLAPRRGQDQTGVTDRVVNQLLTALDGASPLSGVWVVAATSRPDLIDPAVLRPGRIGIRLRCHLPLMEERVEILECLGRKTRLSEEVGRAGLEEVAEATEGFTGADLKAVLTTAQINALNRVTQSLSTSNPLSIQELLVGQSNPDSDELSKKMAICLEDLRSAIASVKPSLSSVELLRYKSIYEEFEKGKPSKVTRQKVTHA